MVTTACSVLWLLLFMLLLPLLCCCLGSSLVVGGFVVGFPFAFFSLASDFFLQESFLHDSKYFSKASQGANKGNYEDCIHNGLRSALPDPEHDGFELVVGRVDAALHLDAQGRSYHSEQGGCEAHCAIRLERHVHGH